MLVFSLLSKMKFAIQNMSNWSMSLAAELPDESRCDITAHTIESMDSVKRKRLKSVR